MRAARPWVARALALTLLGSPVLAQQGADLSEVESLARRARTLYQQERYDEAVQAYLEAYRKAPAAAVLYNVAHIYDRKLREPELATDFYRRYIRAPDADPAAVARATRRITELKAEQAARAARERRRPPPPPPEPVPPAARAPVEPGGSDQSVAGWVTLGTGLAVAGAGAVVGILARDKAVRYRDLDEPDREGLRTQGLEQALLADILFGVGGAAVVGGVVLLLTDDGGETALRVGPGGAAWVGVW